jgi:hypothetical protein
MMRIMAQGTSKPAVTSTATTPDCNAADAPRATSSKPKVSSGPKPGKKSTARFRSKTASAKRASQQGAEAEKTSNRKRRLASLFMSLLASSPMALEYDATDAATIEAAKKASIAPKMHAKSHKRKVSMVRTVEIRPSRWKRVQYGMKLDPKGRASKKGGWAEFEMDSMQTVKA